MSSAGLTALQLVPFAVVGLNTVTDTWDGSPLVLQVNQSVTMPQTPNGSVVFAYQNQATQNNSGDLIITSGGGAPIPLTAPALTNQTSILTQNWKGNNLTVTNVSVNNNTPIRIQAVGPGMPGTTPLTLPIGTPLSLSPGETAQTNALPQYMQLNFQNTNGMLAIFVLIGGPPDSSGNNAYVISVNAGSNTGPPSSQPAPTGYYATTTNNSYVYTFNWGSSVVFVANMSGLTSTGSDVVLRAL
jgi:hypothetical protein